jgi:RNA polymerase sigma factor (sigma-70 family)
MTAVLLETRAAIEEGLFDEDYLCRLRRGDDETARHFDRYFRRRIRAKVWNKFSRQRAADLVDEVMTAALLSILRGQPANAGRLPAYVFGICGNLTRVAMRPKSHVEVPHANLDYFPDDERTILDRLREAEVRQAVLEVLGTLRQRDREVLVDLFYNGLSRLEVSEKHAVTRDQLRMILFQALKTFKKKWEICKRQSV